MATKRTLSEAQTLEQYRIALENLVNQPQIATTMAEFGYDADTIAEGNALWQTANETYLLNKTEDDESSEASANFKAIKEELATAYSLHRKKAKVIFRKDNITANLLGITGSLAQSYISWLETVKKFYAEALANDTIQSKLARLKVTPDELTATNTLISTLETARTTYLREKGESQNATQAKDQAFTNLDDWMSEFYAVAAIALEENPQLLESLSKVVKG